MNPKYLWKAILFVLGLFFLLHAFGALQIVNMGIVDALFGFQGTTTHDLREELLPQTQFLFYLACALILIAAFLKIVFPKKTGGITDAIHHGLLGAIYNGITYMYCYLFAVLAIDGAAFTVNAMLHIAPPLRLNAAFLFLAVMCFDNAFGIIEKLMAAKRKHDKAKQARA